MTLCPVTGDDSKMSLSDSDYKPCKTSSSILDSDTDSDSWGHDGDQIVAFLLLKSCLQHNNVRQLLPADPAMVPRTSTPCCPGCGGGWGCNGGCGGGRLPHGNCRNSPAVVAVTMDTASTAAEGAGWKICLPDAYCRRFLSQNLLH